MPGWDQTGPFGTGPFGRGMGPCGGGFGGRGRGFRFFRGGAGWGMGAPYQTGWTNEKEALEQRKDWLQNLIGFIDQQLKYLEEKRGE